jgi:hypothetical protein
VHNARFTDHQQHRNVPLPVGAVYGDIWEYGERIIVGPRAARLPQAECVGAAY